MIKVNLVFILFLVGSVSWSKPLSQMIYESQIKRRCADVSEIEVNTLRTCSPNRFGQSIGDLDKAAEYLVFKPIAESESNRLKCLLSQASRLRYNQDVQTTAVNHTCSKLAFLKEIISNEAFLQSWIKSYTTANDRRVRDISDEEFKNNEAVLNELQQRLGVVRELASSLRASDVLLANLSARFYLRKPFQRSAKTEFKSFNHCLKRSYQNSLSTKRSQLMRNCGQSASGVTFRRLELSSKSTLFDIKSRH
jgi:hypothetical protein